MLRFHSVLESLWAGPVSPSFQELLPKGVGEGERASCPPYLSPGSLGSGVVGIWLKEASASLEPHARTSLGVSSKAAGADADHAFSGLCTVEKLEM